MKIRDLMTHTVGDVVGVEEGDSLQVAAKRLADEEVGALAVFGPSGMKGVFSERDLARAVSDGVEVDEIPVGEYIPRPR
jgi:CBS domain-containing protein